MTPLVVSDTVLLEREKELELLADLLADIGSSGGKVVLIRGEAGIGKSALVREFVDAHADRAHVLFGACDDLLTPQPLGPFWDIARDEPSLAQPLETGDRQAVLASCLDLLSRSLRPSIMVIEDTHWADEATFDAIKYLGRRSARTNGLLLLTYRDGEVDYDHPLRQVIGDLPPQSVVRIRLGGLSKSAVSSIIGGSSLDPDEVLAATHGNPFLVTEMASTDGEAIPSSVQDSVMTRVRKLSPQAHQMLKTLSVVPERVSRAEVVLLTGGDESRLVECERRGLLVVGAEFVSFRHELIRRAVEASLTISERVATNRKVLEVLPPETDLARLVHHAREAIDIDRLVELAPLAARAAADVSSHREAVAHYRTLGPYLDRIAEPARATILEDWARSEFYLDNIEALELLNRAIDLHRFNGDDLSLANALTSAVRVNMVHGRPEAAEACSVEGIKILESRPPSPDLAFAVSQYAWLSLELGEVARAEALTNSAHAIAEETGGELAAIHALNIKGILAYVRGESDGFQLMEMARSRAERGGYRFEEVGVLLSMEGVTAELREMERAADLAQRARDTAARYEIRTLEVEAQARYADVLAWKGEWAAAEDAAAEALGSRPHVDVTVGWVLGGLQARRGRPEARRVLDRTWSLAEEGGNLANMLPAAAAKAENMWLTEVNDPDLAERFQELLAEGIRREFPWLAGPLGFWLWKLGDITEAPEGIPEPYRLVIEGEPLKAAAIWQAKGVPYERGLALMHGDPASRLEALEIFETLGATAVAAKLRKALRDEGVAVPRGKGRETRGHAAGLTARQAEVLQLLDEDLTNAEIADRLFVSPRTIENHVSAVLNKLDASTREEAVSRAHSEGLLAR